MNPYGNVANSNGSNAPSIAVVGGGYWGKNLIRNMARLQQLHTICDSRTELLQQYMQDYPEARCTSDLSAVLNDPTVLGVMVATPSQTHYLLARQAILAGKTVYVEKPLATTLADAQTLVELAQQQGVDLMVGHLLLYHPVVNRLRHAIESGALGELRYIHCDRLNFNVGRNDKSVLWDLAPHDLSLILYLTGQTPQYLVQSVGQASDPNDNKVDSCYVSLAFANGLLAHIHTSWVYPTKQVQLLVVGTKASAILDDTQPAERKLKLVHRTPTGQTEETFLQALPLEPLKLECQHFINRVTQRIPVQTGTNNALAVIQWLEQAEQQMAVSQYRCSLPLG